MVKRKSSKKTAKKSPQDAVIIDGVAEDVDPAQVKSKAQKSKTSPIEKQTTRPAGLGVILSLIALFCGGAGAALGTLAYLSVNNMNNRDDLNEVTNKIVEDQINMALAPLHDQIKSLETSIDTLAANSQTDIAVQNDVITMQSDISAIKDTLANVQEVVSVQGSNADASYKPHTHEHFATSEIVNSQIASLRNDLEELKATSKDQHVTPSISEETLTDDQPWWNTLFGAFSITRIETKDDEGTE